ncbi:MAG: phosphoglucomutase/phosphomannomutase PgmG [Kiloniellales bacterium]
MSGHRFDPAILREYDIRGTVGRTLSEADAAALGRAFGTTLVRGGGTAVAVGYDGRLSSPALEAALVAGLASTGLAVQRVGRGPTPMLSYAAYTLPVDGGVMVTGSHNPPDDNGFKMTRNRAPVYGEAVQALGRIAAAGDFVEGQGKVEERPIAAAYLERLLQDVKAGGRPLAVGWDAGNGAGGEIVTALAARLPGRHVLLNCEIDGTFPAHHPDPTVPKNLLQLQEAVAREKLDCGIALDGDADRIGVIDEMGGILWGDQLLLIFAREVLSRRPGAPIIADVKTSQVVYDAIAEAGGEPVMWKTGHSLIKAKMAEMKAPLGGELSGHIFFSDGFYGFDDAIYAGIRLLNILGAMSEPLSAFRRTVPAVVSTPEIRIPCPPELKGSAVEGARTRLEAAGAEVNVIDGVRVKTADGWWLLRASNTQDVLVARCEAFDRAGLERLFGILSEQLKASGLEPPALEA